MDENPLLTWAEGLMPKPYRTKEAVAEAAGLTSSAFWRQVRSGKLGVEPLLRLAYATGESATSVLTLAGKGALAKLIELNYGAPTPSRYPAVRELVAELEQVPPFAPSVLRLVREARAAWQHQGSGDKLPPAAQVAGAHKPPSRAVLARKARE